MTSSSEGGGSKFDRLRSETEPFGVGAELGSAENPVSVEATFTPSTHTPSHGTPITAAEAERDGRISASALRLAVICMSVVLICVAAVTFVVVLNAQADQRNADALVVANEELRNEVRCRAVPQLAYDKAFSDLQVGIAEALVALGSDEALGPIVEDLPLVIEAVRVALNAREASLGACVAGG